MLSDRPMLRAGELRCEVLDSYAALVELAPAWRALCEQCPSATPFQRPEWLLAWARRFGPARPWIVAVHDAERLLGLAPMFVDERRVLRLLGAGVSDYLDLLIAAGREPEVWHALLAALAARRDGFAVLELDQLRPWASPILQLELPSAWASELLVRDVCPSVPLPDRVDALGLRVPSHQLARLRKVRRRADRLGALRLERATPHSCARLLDAFMHLHERRWRLRGEPGCFADPDVRAFHHEAAAEFAARDQLALYGLFLDERIIAGVYAFEQHRCAFAYLGGFDPGFAKLSPGALAIGMVLEDAIARGLDRFDFMRGTEDYKYSWGAEDRTTTCMRLTWRGA